MPSVPLPALELKALAGFAPQLITDGAGLERVSKFIQTAGDAPKVPWETVKTPIVGIDTETNITVDFFWRRIRTIQIGNTMAQFCIDLLAFADGDEQKLIGAQGLDGKNSAIFAPIKKVLEPVLCSNQYLKVGQHLPFEYEVLRWNLGMRIWNLYSIDLVERVIKAGAVSLKNYPYFSLEQIIGRYFGKRIDKTLQTSFDLKTPLTQDQVDYSCLDIYAPLAVRQKQLKVIQQDRLCNTSKIECDAIGSYTDMHINGQNIDRPRWVERIEKRKLEWIEAIETLDTFFIPVVGRKDEAIDETELDRLEAIWKNDFEVATPEEMAKAAEVRLVGNKDPLKKEALKAELRVLVQARAALKAKARADFYVLSKKRTKARQLIEKCVGMALINYNSGPQLLAAFQKMRGYMAITATDKDTLLGFNDKPAIPPLLLLNKLKKEIGTYGLQWTQEWTTHPCKEEGWLHPGDGRLHCLYNQLEAETGRSSSSKPNAQNLPKDDDVRACFICDPPNENIRISVCCDTDTTRLSEGVYACTACGKVCETKAEEYCLVTCDMAGAELRIIAELANAQSWITAFAKGRDVHSVGTEILYPDLWPTLTVKSLLHPNGWTLEDAKTEKVPLFNKDGSPLMKPNKKTGVKEHVHVPPCAYFALNAQGELARQKCECPGHKKLRDGNKATNFLLAYGGGPSALADALGITKDAAKELMKLHESKFPDVWGYLKRSGEQARFNKEARDLYGRRRLFPPPTWDGAREFFIQEHDDVLEIDEDDAERNIFNFKAKELREPTEEEEYMLTHRDPTSKEISSMYKGMFSSIERRGKNMCIQGSNASIIKRAMGCGFDKNGKGYLWHLLPTLRAIILSMVHDELIIQCPKRFGQKVLDCVGDAFRRAGAEVMKKVIMEYDGCVSNRWQK